MNNMKEKYRAQLTLKRKSIGPVVIPLKEDKITWFMKGKLAWFKLMRYPERKLWNIATFGFMACVFMGTFTYKFNAYRVDSAEFSKIGKSKFLEQKKIISILGEPLQFGHVYASAKDSIQETEVDVIIPVSGKDVNGYLRYRADKNDGFWIIRDMKFEFMDEAGGVVHVIRDPREATDSKELTV